MLHVNSQSPQHIKRYGKTLRRKRWSRLEYEKNCNAAKAK